MINIEKVDDEKYTFECILDDACYATGKVEVNPTVPNLGMMHIDYSKFGKDEYIATYNDMLLLEDALCEEGIEFLGATHFDNEGVEKWIKYITVFGFDYLGQHITGEHIARKAL